VWGVVLCTQHTHTLKYKYFCARLDTDPNRILKDFAIVCALYCIIMNIEVIQLNEVSSHQVILKKLAYVCDFIFYVI